MQGSTKRKWKTVNLDSHAGKGIDDFEYLQSFEELTAYSIVEEKRKRRKNISKNKEKGKGKRKVTPNCPTNSAATSENVQENADVCSNADLEDKPQNCSDHELVGDSSCQSSNELTQWDGIFIPSSIARALTELNFNEFTAIQKLVLPCAMRDKLDIVAAAETGSGKTLAFGVPIVSDLLALEESAVECHGGLKSLILVPTRELALQVKNHIAAILKYTRLKITVVIGGLAIEKQRRLLKRRPDIIVATPGRLWELIQEGNEFLKNLSCIRHLVVDEADRMVEKGHFEELHNVLSLINEEENNPDARKRRQTFVFSATLTFVHPPPRRLFSKHEIQQMSPKQKIDSLVAMVGIRKKYKVLDITRKIGTAEGLVEARINCSDLVHKDARLHYFLCKYPGRTLVFANSINSVRRLQNILIRLRLKPYTLHAKMQQKQRLKNLERFSASKESILLATDVAARGLDIKNVEHVIHYHVPRTAEVYIHRSGRTARATQKGLAVMLVDPADASTYKKICTNLNRESDLPVFPIDENRFSEFHRRVELAVQLESCEHQLKRVRAKQNWFKTAADAVGVELDDDDLRKNMGDNDSILQSDSKIKSLNKQLTKLLNEIPRNFGQVTKYPAAFSDVSTTDVSTGQNVDALSLISSDATKKKQKVPHLKLKLRLKKRHKRK